jgi:hypothetical protein
MYAHAHELAVDKAAAIEILLLLADADAHWSEYDRALGMLDEVEHAVGRIPAEYEMKRLRWLQLRRIRS